MTRTGYSSVSLGSEGVDSLFLSLRAWNQTIYVDLFDTEGEEIHINKVLIERGLAKEADHTVSNPWNIEASFKFNSHMTIGLPG